MAEFKQPIHLFDCEMNYPTADNRSLNYPSVSYEKTWEYDVKEVIKVVASEEELTTVLENGGNVILSDNLELTKPMVVSGNVTVNLNNCEIKAPVFAESNGEISEGNSDSYAVWVKEGNIELNGEGNVVAQAATYSMAVWANGGNVTINGGKYSNNGEGSDLIYASNGGNVYINGGEFVACKKEEGVSGTADTYVALNVKDADYKAGKSNIFVTGGRFYMFDPANNQSEGPNTNFVVEGYESIADGDWFVVQKKA